MTEANFTADEKKVFRGFAVAVVIAVIIGTAIINNREGPAISTVAKSQPVAGQPIAAPSKPAFQKQQIGPWTVSGDGFCDATINFDGYGKLTTNQLGGPRVFLSWFSNKNGEGTRPFLPDGTPRFVLAISDMLLPVVIVGREDKDSTFARSLNNNPFDRADQKRITISGVGDVVMERSVSGLMDAELTPDQAEDFMVGTQPGATMEIRYPGSTLRFPAGGKPLMGAMRECFDQMRR